jgi:hypothetical protein
MAMVSEALSLKSRLVFEYTLELPRQVFPENDAGVSAGMEVQVMYERDQAIACHRSETGDGACRGLWIRHGEFAEVSG